MQSDDERRHTRARLEARKLVEDKATAVLVVTCVCLAGVGGTIGGIHGAAGSAIGAALASVTGALIGGAYKFYVLKRATQEALRKESAQTPLPANGPSPHD